MIFLFLSTVYIPIWTVAVSRNTFTCLKLTLITSGLQNVGEVEMNGEVASFVVFKDEIFYTLIKMETAYGKHMNFFFSTNCCPLSYLESIELVHIEYDGFCEICFFLESLNLCV